MISYRLEFIDMLRRVFEREHPHLHCTLSFANDPGAFPNGERGLVNIPDDGSPAEIVINAEVPYMFVLDVIAHELAHLVAPPDGDELPHTKEWEMVYKRLVRLTCKEAGIPAPLFVRGLRHVMNKRDEERNA